MRPRLTANQLEHCRRALQLWKRGKAVAMIARTRGLDGGRSGGGATPINGADSPAYGRNPFPDGPRLWPASRKRSWPTSYYRGRKRQGTGPSWGLCNGAPK